MTTEQVLSVPMVLPEIIHTTYPGTTVSYYDQVFLFIYLFIYLKKYARQHESINLNANLNMSHNIIYK